jgi:hypothetical protein
MSSTASLDDPAAIPESTRTVEISRRHAERYRWRCPHGHVDWDRTNNHLWCAGCRRQCEAGDDVDPEHYYILDMKNDELIAWENVRLKE